MPSLGGKRVLVTGAGGFLGRSLVARLAADGAVVHGVWRTTPPEEGDATAGSVGVEWHRADLARPDEARRLLDACGPEVVFHLASAVHGARGREHVLPVLGDNLLAAVHLLVAAGESTRIVLAGSMEEPETGPAGGAEPVPCSPYAAAKWAASGYGRMFHALYGADVRLARIFMVYGPGQRDARKLVPYVIRSLLAGEAPKLASGKREVDWVFVEDVADALVAIAAAPGLAGRTIDVGTGKLASVGELVESIRSIVGRETGSAVPEALFGALPDRPLEVVRAARADETAERIGWRARVGLEEGLARTVAWYRERIREGR